MAARHGLDIATLAQVGALGHHRPLHAQRVAVRIGRLEHRASRLHVEAADARRTVAARRLAADLKIAAPEYLFTAALLHDIGKGIDNSDHVNAGLQALDGLLTERTAWLIENHMLAHDFKAGTLGNRAKRRLETHTDFDDLMLLNECDVSGRVPGAYVGTVDQALEFIREVEQANRGK